MPSDMILSRRAIVAGLAAAAALAALPRPALALTAEAAKSLVDKTVGDINSIINSGKSESAMLRDFEKLASMHDDAYADYMRACCYAKLGDAARVFLHARATLEKDATYAEYFSDDEDFAAYRDDPSWPK